MNQPKTAEEQRNAAVIRELYGSAEAAAKDTPKFVSFFGEGGYFYDVGAGKNITERISATSWTSTPLPSRTCTVSFTTCTSTTMWLLWSFL